MKMGLSNSTRLPRNERAHEMGANEGTPVPMSDPNRWGCLTRE
jgi:hypothetical protein